MEEDGIILGGEGVTTDEILFRSEIIEEFSKMFHANRSNVCAKRRKDTDCSTSLSSGPAFF